MYLVLRNPFARVWLLATSLERVGDPRVRHELSILRRQAARPKYFPRPQRHRRAVAARHVVTAHLLRGRERLARMLGMGELQLSGTMPSGQVGVLMPQRMYFVGESTATLDGVDLGQPTHVEPNLTIGDVPLPASGVLAIGQATWRILDSAEYERTRREIQLSSAPKTDTT